MTWNVSWARYLGVACGILFLLLLTFYQYLNMLLVASAAQPGSWVASLQLSDIEHAQLSRSLVRKLPLSLERRFAAMVALRHFEAAPSAEHADEVDKILALLSQASDRKMLEASFAAASGHTLQAVRLGFDAHAYRLVNSLLDRLMREKKYTSTAKWNNIFMAQLQGKPREREMLADAYWRAGAIENAYAARCIHTSDGMVHRRAALAAFQAELLLTPLSGRALLSAGYAALALNNETEARHDFAKALALDPRSDDARRGLRRLGPQPVP